MSPIFFPPSAFQAPPPFFSSAVSRSVDTRGQIRGSVRDRGLAVSGVVDACLVIVANVVKKTFEEDSDVSSYIDKMELDRKTASLFSAKPAVLI